jgi:hypothetical protein
LGDPTSQRRPTASDIILLTIRTIDDPTQILGGASIPVSRIPSFPARFFLNEKNALPSSSTLNWKSAMETTDILVEAVVCSRDIVEEKRAAGYKDWLNATAFCSATNAPNGPPISGQGIAKFLILNSGPMGSNPIIIRAPASVVLN